MASQAHDFWTKLFAVKSAEAVASCPLCTEYKVRPMCKNMKDMRMRTSKCLSLYDFFFNLKVPPEHAPSSITATTLLACLYKVIVKPIKDAGVQEELMPDLERFYNSLAASAQLAVDKACVSKHLTAEVTPSLSKYFEVHINTYEAPPSPKRQRVVQEVVEEPVQEVVEQVPVVVQKPVAVVEQDDRYSSLLAMNSKLEERLLSCEQTILALDSKLSSLKAIFDSNSSVGRQGMLTLLERLEKNAKPVRLEDIRVERMSTRDSIERVVEFSKMNVYKPLRDDQLSGSIVVMNNNALGEHLKRKAAQ